VWPVCVRDMGLESIDREGQYIEHAIDNTLHHLLRCRHLYLNPPLKAPEHAIGLETQGMAKRSQNNSTVLLVF